MSLGGELRVVLRRGQQVVERRGPGSGVDYVSQDPHVFYMSVDSDGLEWKISVDEGIAGEVVGSSR